MTTSDSSQTTTTTAYDLLGRTINAWQSTRETTSSRDQLRAAAMLLAWIEDQEMASSVQSLREEGATWEEIGDLLRITRQAAHKRFQHLR